MKRHQLGAVALTIGLSAAALAVVPSAAQASPVPAAVSAAAIPGVPSTLTCYWRGKGVTASGQIIRRSVTYRDGKISVESNPYGPGRLPFVPRTATPPGGVGGYPFVNDYFAVTSKDGYFYQVSAVGQTSYNDVKVTAKRTAATWGGVRLMVTAGSYLPSDGQYAYGVHDSGGMYRYIVNDAPAPHTRVTINTSGWKGVRTLSWVRSTTVPGTKRAADVLLATTSGGQLVEYTIPLDQPTKWTRKDLKPATWNVFNYVNQASCTNGMQNSATRLLVGVKPSGEVYLYLDKNGNDGSGADLTGLGRIATGWKDQLFSL